MNYQQVPIIMHISSVAVILIGFLEVANAQCDGDPREISSGEGQIQSPNYLNEYGMEANCTWNFIRPDGGNQLLELTVVTMRLYFVDSEGGRYCPGSYDLAIAGEILDCTRLVAGTNDRTPFCHAFNSTCTDRQSPCESVRTFSSTINVTYNSDGRISVRSQSVWGFRIAYKYIECEAAPTITSSSEPGTDFTDADESQTASTLWRTTSKDFRPSITAAPMIASSSEPGTDFTSADESQTASTSWRATSKDFRPSITDTIDNTTTGSAPPGPNYALAIGLGTAAGAFVIAGIVVIAYCFWRRKETNGQPSGMDLEGEEPPVYYENHPERKGKVLPGSSSEEGRNRPTEGERSSAFVSSGDTPEGEYENKTLPRIRTKAITPPSAHEHTYANASASQGYDVVEDDDDYESWDDDVEL